MKLPEFEKSLKIKPAKNKIEELLELRLAAARTDTVNDIDLLLQQESRHFQQDVRLILQTCVQQFRHDFPTPKTPGRDRALVAEIATMHNQLTDESVLA